MSASLLVDLFNTCDIRLTLGLGGAGSGLIYPCSGAVFGDIVGMPHDHVFTNLLVAGNRVCGSGQLRVVVQTAPDTNSGSFTDPTSGAASFPTAFTSGTILTLGANSGGTLGPAVSGQNIQSGFAVGAGFQRPAGHIYARAYVMSGDFFAGPLTAMFVEQKRTTGSGGGFSYSPGSGAVNV